METDMMERIHSTVCKVQKLISAAGLQKTEWCKQQQKDLTKSCVTRGVPQDSVLGALRFVIKVTT